MNPHRGRINHRGQPISFFFEGRSLQGRVGETVASALMRAGVRTFGRSLKYRRPRSLHCGRGRCGMCQMEVDGVPGVPVCLTKVSEGMKVRRHSKGGISSLLAGHAASLLPLPAGFYYRLFTRPRLLNLAFQRVLSGSAGAARLDPLPALSRGAAPIATPAVTGRTYDVAVVGAGLSGLRAALGCARAGIRTLVVEEYDLPGGNNLVPQDPSETKDEIDGLARALRETSGADLLFSTRAVGFYPPAKLVLAQERTLFPVTARAFIFATGAYDLVPLFANNDLPGIFGSRALALLAGKQGIKLGTRAVVYGTRDTTVLACSLRDWGMEVAAVVDPGGEGRVREEVEEGGFRYLGGFRVIRTYGGEWVAGVELDGGDRGRLELACDLLAVSFPGQAAFELPYQAGFHYRLAGGGIWEDRTMVPTLVERTGEGGIAFFLVGEAAGNQSAEEKRQGAERAAQAVSEAAASRREG